MNHVSSENRRCGLCWKDELEEFKRSPQEHGYFYRCLNPDCRAEEEIDGYGDYVWTVKNACRCTICGHAANRYAYGFKCTNPECGAMGDLFCGIFSRLDYEYYEKMHKDSIFQKVSRFFGRLKAKFSRH